MSTTPSPTDDRPTNFKNRKIPVIMGRGGGFSNPVPGRAGPKVIRPPVVEDACCSWIVEELTENAMPKKPKKAMEARKIFGFGF